MSAKLYELAKDAINAVFAAFDASKKEVIRDLQGLQEEIEVLLESLEESGGE